ncbi:hypothetical protein [Acinetobacter phage P1068]|nr:hypothetical protein [Acinetobacter phage P1068]
MGYQEDFSQLSSERICAHRVVNQPASSIKDKSN